MQDKLTFLSQALSPTSEIKFKTPIAHLIPKIPTPSIVDNSSLLACGGYSITLKASLLPKKSSRENTLASKKQLR